MPSAVGMDHGSVGCFRHRLYGGIQHGVDQFSVWARANGPAHHHPVEAIDDRRQVDLTRRYLELRDVGEPFLVGGCSLEVTVDDVLWCRADLAQVRRIPSPLGFCNDYALLLHQPLYHLFGDRALLPSQRGLQPAVAAAAVVRLEDFSDRTTRREVLVARRCTGPMVEVRTTSKTQLCKEL